MKYHRLDGLQTTEIYFSLSGSWKSELRVVGLRSGCQHGRVLVKALFHVADCRLLTVSLHRRRGQWSLWSLFYKALTSFMRVLPSWFKHSLKVQPPNTVIFEGQDYNIWILGGHKHSEYSKNQPQFWISSIRNILTSTLTLLKTHTHTQTHTHTLKNTLRNNNGKIKHKKIIRD